MINGITYTVKKGDTLSDIATIYYGEPSKYTIIFNANPEIIDPDLIYPGQRLIIPNIEAVSNTVNSTSLDNIVTIFIGQTKLEDFWGFTIKFGLDTAADLVKFETPFDSSIEENRDLFEPYAYKPIQVFIDSDPVFTGTIINITPTTESDKNTLTLEAYSLTGILNDCTYPTTAYPLTFEGLTLPQIAKKSASYFNLGFVDSTNDSYMFKDEDVHPSTVVFSYLSGLAKKRGVILTNDNMGNFVVTFASTISAMQTLVEGSPNVLSITNNSSGQKFFTTYAGLLDENVDEGSSNTYTAKNKFMVDVSVRRPTVFEVDNVETGALKEVVESTLKRTVGASVTYTLAVEGWRDSNQELWHVNKRLNVQYPSIQIYEPYEFLIKDLTFSKDSSKEVTTMLLVLPQAYVTTEDIARLPWSR